MIPFAPWLPDIADFNTNASSDVVNVIPSSTGFKPFSGLATITNTLTARPQGAISVRSIGGNIYNFCGDATKLYRLSTNGLVWNDVSRTVGGGYATPIDKWWDFSLFGDTLIATNGIDPVQYFTLDVSSNFSALSGSPPISAFTGNVRDFSVLARQSTSNNKIKWSAINNAFDWVASATTMSDSQIFPDGGQIMGFVGGEFGVVFLERAIYRMAFEGPPTIFRFDKISSFLGCRAEHSIATFDNLVFFLSDDGFYMVQGGSQIIPIGTKKVDRAFEKLLNGDYLYRISATIDPVRKLYIIGFSSTNSPISGQPDKIFVYHWPTGEWAKEDVLHSYLYTAMGQQSFTIDGMDAVSSTIDGLVYPVDSRFWSGSGRQQLAAFDLNNKQGFFSGEALEAVIETGDTQLTVGHLSLLRGVRPIIEGSMVTPSVTIRSRKKLQDALVDSPVIPVNEFGYCPTRVNARYHRAKVTIPAGSTWEFALGIDDLKFSSMGAR